MPLPACRHGDRKRGVLPDFKLMPSNGSVAWTGMVLCRCLLGKPLGSPASRFGLLVAT